MEGVRKGEKNPPPSSCPNLPCRFPASSLAVVQESLMVNPGAFRGSRKEFLLGEQLAYAIAVRSGDTADAIAKIQQRYLKRYPIDLPHDQEPSAEWLAAVDDQAPDPEPKLPQKDEMSEEEYEAAMKKVDERKALLKFRKMQIKRWMASHHMKALCAPPKDSGAHNPYTALLKKLIGSNVARPRQKSAANLWRKPHKKRIEAHLQGEIELGWKLNQPVLKDDHAKIRDRIARELFAELDDDTRRRWLQKAIDEHHEALKEYNRQINGDPSTAPEDRQLAIQGLVQFMQPILDRVSAATGWKLSLLAGGPEPASGGHLSMISVHSGYTTGDIPMTFGRAERVRYKKHIVPIFGSFMRLCYSPEECQSRALRTEDGYLSVALLEGDTDEATYHSIDMTTTPKPTPAVNAQPPIVSAPEPQSNNSPSASNNNDSAGGQVEAITTEDDDGMPSLCDASEDEDDDEDDETLSQSLVNPFPFVDCDDVDEMLFLDQIPVLSRPGSPPVSPPVSRPGTPPISPPVSRPGSRAVSPEPQSLKDADATAERLAVDIANITINSADGPDTEPVTVPLDTAIQTSRKRKIKDVPEPPLVKPGSKRMRTKTTRAIEAEEQQRPKRVQGARKAVGQRGVGDSEKENKTTKQRNGASKGAGKRR